MSAEDNLSQELFFTVHRGLTRKPQKGKGLGMHWSADPAVARKFAGPFGHVIHGEIPISSVETDSETLRRNAVFLPDNEQGHRMEKEVSVTIGKPVKVTGITGPEADPTTGFWNGRRNEGVVAASGAKRPARRRTYKNPKNMTA